MGEPEIIRRADRARAGLTDAALKQLFSAGTITRIRRGSYVDAATTANLELVERHTLAVRAALADQRDRPVVSHLSAVVAWGLPIWRMDLGTVHLTRQRRSAGRRTSTLHVHTAPLEPTDVVELDGVPLTSAARTIFDVACQLPFEQAVVLADAALHAGLVTPEQLRQQLTTGFGRWGRANAALAFDFADGRSESVGESRSRVGMYRAGLPVPNLQCTIRRADGRVVGRPDFDWAPVPLLGEFDGLHKYDRYVRDGETSADVVVREKLREDALRELGFLLVRWIWAELDDPAQLYRRISAALARAAKLAR